jgi:hypothetical protein
MFSIYLIACCNILDQTKNEVKLEAKRGNCQFVNYKILLLTSIMSFVNLDNLILNHLSFQSMWLQEYSDSHDGQTDSRRQFTYLLINCNTEN